jgi:hypothetical protein
MGHDSEIDGETSYEACVVSSIITRARPSVKSMPLRQVESAQLIESIGARNGRAVRGLATREAASPTGNPASDAAMLME